MLQFHLIDKFSWGKRVVSYRFSGGYAKISRIIKTQVYPCFFWAGDQVFYNELDMTFLFVFWERGAHLGHIKSTRIHWKADAPETSHTDLGPEALLGHFSMKMSKKRTLQSMAIVIGPCWKNFCSQNLKRRILATCSFNRTALRATQPKLQSMFYALFWRSHYQPQSWCRLATSELRFDTVALCGVPS